MARNSRSPRATGTTPRSASTPPHDLSPETSSLLARLGGDAALTDVLPSLHQRAIGATGGVCTLLFEQNPRNGILHATSGYGLDILNADPWVPADTEMALLTEALHGEVPLLVTNLERQMPDLAGRLTKDVGLLVPLVRASEPIGLLVIGFDGAPSANSLADEVSEVAKVFQITLELFRLRKGEDMRREMGTLLDELIESLSASGNTFTSLDRFCERAARLVGADVAAVWLHDRAERHLTRRSSSHPDDVGPANRVSTDDPFAEAALTLRRRNAKIEPSAGGAPTQTVMVPLRGYRRALGALAFEGVRVEPGEELEWLDCADELGRRLAGALEATQLIHDAARAKRELRGAIDAVEHLMVVADRHGRIVDVNDGFARRLGIVREELVDRPLVECVGPELAAWLVELETGTRAGGTLPAVVEVEDSVLSGVFTISATVLRDRDRQRAGMVVVARVQSGGAALETEHHDLRNRLTQSEKLAALGQFVAGIAHELNNPLQSVLGHLELLRGTGAFPRQLRPEVQTIYREADRAAKIVRNLLVFAGSRRLVRRPVSLNSLLQRVVRIRQASCRAQNIEIVRHYDEALPRVKSDPLLLHQVFLNMVMNAEQAITAAGRPGRIDITTASSNGGSRIVVTVRDSGNGIPPEALSRIFEPFYTTKEVGKGTGLGLAIAYGIVQDHGGQIAAANHPDGGALFTVELPRGPSA